VTKGMRNYKDILARCWI